MTTAAQGRPGLLERLEQGPVICAEGYLFELERRGFLQAGPFVPEVVLEHPELVDPAAPGVRARGLRRRRGIHLLRAPREDAPRRQGAPAGADQPPGARAGEGRRGRERRALRGRHLQHERLRRRRRVAAGGARDVRGAGRLGRRRRRRLRHRRDLHMGRGSADRARGDQGGRPAGRDDPCDPPAGHDVGRLVARGGVQAARGRRRGRGRAELQPRPENDAAAARARPVRRQRTRRRTAGAVPDERRRADVPVAQRPRGRPASRRQAVPHGARPVHLQPVRDRRVRDRPRTSSGSPTSGCAAARGRITSAASPRRSAGRRPRAATRPTCPSTRSSAPTSASSTNTRSTPRSSDACRATTCTIISGRSR